MFRGVPSLGHGCLSERNGDRGKGRGERGGERGEGGEGSEGREGRGARVAGEGARQQNTGSLLTLLSPMFLALLAVQRVLVKKCWLQHAASKKHDK